MSAADIAYALGDVRRAETQLARPLPAACPPREGARNSRRCRGEA